MLAEMAGVDNETNHAFRNRFLQHKIMPTTIRASLYQLYAHSTNTAIPGRNSGSMVKRQTLLIARWGVWLTIHVSCPRSKWFLSHDLVCCTASSDCERMLNFHTNACIVCIQTRYDISQNDSFLYEVHMTYIITEFAILHTIFVAAVSVARPMHTSTEWPQPSSGLVSYLKHYNVWIDLLMGKHIRAY